MGKYGVYKTGKDGNVVQVSEHPKYEPEHDCAQEKCGVKVGGPTLTIKEAEPRLYTGLYL
jgi:hypothetical protein